MAVVHRQCNVTGICHDWGSLLWGTNGICLLCVVSILARLQAAVLLCPTQQWWGASGGMGACGQCHFPLVALTWAGCQAGAAECRMGPGECWGCFGPLRWHLLSAASMPYSGPGVLPATHCWGVLLKGTWRSGFALVGARLS